jgi:hypothetical protein
MRASTWRATAIRSGLENGDVSIAEKFLTLVPWKIVCGKVRNSMGGGHGKQGAVWSIDRKIP